MKGSNEVALKARRSGNREALNGMAIRQDLERQLIRLDLVDGEHGERQVKRKRKSRSRRGWRRPSPKFTSELKRSFLPTLACLLITTHNYSATASSGFLLPLQPLSEGPLQLEHASLSSRSGGSSSAL